MLTICQDPLPRTDLTYAAFRASFRETLERFVLARQFDDDPWQCFGFLTKIPFLKAVPPQVQLDLLSQTWDRHVCADHHEATLVDEAVIYAACETASRLAHESPAELGRLLAHGPQKLVRGVDDGLAEPLKQLHMALDSEGDFLLVSQFEDLPPEEAETRKREICLETDRLEGLFEALAHWWVAPGFAQRLTGLLTRREAAQASRIVHA